MKYAIIQQGGKQYKVTEGAEILVDRLDSVKEGKYEFANVLLVRDEKEIVIGRPNVSDYKVTSKVLGEVKGEKIKVSKFKAKVRYDKTIGFRPKYTRIKVEKIEKAGPKAREKKVDAFDKFSVNSERSRRIDKREKKK